MVIFSFNYTCLDASEDSIKSDNKTEATNFTLSPEVIAVSNQVCGLMHSGTEACALRALITAKMSEQLVSQKDKECFDLASQVYALASFASKQDRDNLFANFEDQHAECAQVVKALFYSKKS